MYRVQNYSKTFKWLKYFFDKNKNKLPIKNFESFANYYQLDQDLLRDYNETVYFDSFYKNYDLSLSDSSELDIKSSLEAIGKKLDGKSMPHYQTFFNALIAEQSDLNFFEFKSAVVEGLEKTAKIAVGGLGAYVAISLGGLLTLFLLRRK